MIRSHLLNVVVILISLVFLISGFCKISPTLNPDTFFMLDEKFRSTIVPALENYVNSLGVVEDFRLNSPKFKTTLGYVEIILVLIMWFGKRGSSLGAFFLSLIMVGAVGTHLLIDEDPTFPAVIGVLCFSITIIASTFPCITKKQKNSSVVLNTKVIPAKSPPPSAVKTIQPTKESTATTAATPHKKKD